MKKILIVFCMVMLLCGCGKEKKENIIKDLKNNINNSKSYKLEGTMEISNDEETFKYNLESYYLKDNYYKIILVNQNNNHEQIILKDNEDIYVITPSLNKSFKFQSEWPGNSSQAYILGNLLNDIENDQDVTIENKDNGYVIKTKVNYPNNNELKYQKIYLNNDKNIEKVEVYNENDIVKIKVNFDKMDLKAGLKKDDFKLSEYIKEEEPGQNIENENTCTGSGCENSESNKTASIESIIYPLYLPTNTYLTSSEKVETSVGDRVILTFSGDKSFVLIEEPTISNNSMEIVPVYGEPLLLSETIGALSASSLSWDVNDISYYLASTALSVDEMQLIANSLGNTTLVANTK